MKKPEVKNYVPQLDGMSKEEALALHRELLDEFTSYCQLDYKREQKIISTYLSVFGEENFIAQGDGSIAKVTYVGADDNKYYSKTNTMLPIYLGTYSKLWNAQPLIQSNPGDLTSKSEFGSELSEAITTDNMKEWRKNGLYSKSLLWYIIGGEAFTENIVNGQCGEVVGYNNEGKKIKKGKIEMRPVHPFCLKFNRTVHNVMQAKRVFKIIPIEKKVFEKMYPGIKAGKSLENALRYKVMITGDYTDIQAEVSLDKYMMLIKMTEIPNIENEDGRIVFMTADEILSTQKYKYPENFGQPYSQSKRIETGTARGETPMSYSVGPSIDISMKRGQLADHAENLAAPIRYVPLGSDFDVKEFAGRRVKVVVYNNKYGKPEEPQPAEFSQFFFTDLAATKNDIQDMNAIHAASMGQREPGVRSGLQQAGLIDADDSRYIPDIAGYFLMFEDAARKDLILRSLYYSEDKLTLMLLGKDNVSYFKYIGSQLKDNTNIIIDVVAGLPLDRKSKQEFLTTLVSAGTITKGQYLSLLELGNLNPIWKIDLKNRIRQIIEIDEIKAGAKRMFIDDEGNDKKMPVEEIINSEDNNLIHIKELIKYFTSSEFYELDNKTKRRLWKHAFLHNQKLVEMFANFPLIATLTHNLAYADEADLAAIQNELMKVTAENNQQPNPGGNGDGSGGGPTNANAMQAISQNPAPPQVMAAQSVAANNKG